MKEGASVQNVEMRDEDFEARVRKRYQELRKQERSRLLPATAETYETVINAVYRKKGE